MGGHWDRRGPLEHAFRHTFVIGPGLFLSFLGPSPVLVSNCEAALKGGTFRNRRGPLEHVFRHTFVIGPGLEGHTSRLRCKASLQDDFLKWRVEQEAEASRQM